MKAVILAAGKSTRTHPLTVHKPKPLLSLLNRPIIDHTFSCLDGIVDEAIIVIGFQAEMLKEYVGKNLTKNFPHIKITFVYQEEQKGTGHALLLCKKYLKNSFLMLNGDDVYGVPDIHNLAKEQSAVLAMAVENVSAFGICTVNKNFELKEIIEKPSSSASPYASTGAFKFPLSIFPKLEKTKPSGRGEIEVTDAINALAGESPVHVILVKEHWLPIGYPWNLLNAQEKLLKDMKMHVDGHIEKNVTIHGNVVLGKGSVIKSGVYIEGPVMIGENCTIGPNCYLRGSTVIGHHCKIGQAVEIKNTLIMDHSNVPHLSYVGDSIICADCNLGAGTIVANLRHDHQNVRSMVNGVLVDSGRRKLGVILADGVHTGINTSIYPGRKIWPGCMTAPGQVVDKDIIGNRN